MASDAREPRSVHSVSQRSTASLVATGAREPAAHPVCQRSTASLVATGAREPAAHPVCQRSTASLVASGAPPHGTTRTKTKQRLEHTPAAQRWTLRYC